MLMMENGKSLNQKAYCFSSILVSANIYRMINSEKGAQPL